MEHKKRQSDNKMTYHAAYNAALHSVGWIDENLKSGRVHFWSKRESRLLLTLDEVIHAIKNGDVTQRKAVK